MIYEKTLLQQYTEISLRKFLFVALKYTLITSQARILAPKY